MKLRSFFVALPFTLGQIGPCEGPTTDAPLLQTSTSTTSTVISTTEQFVIPVFTCDDFPVLTLADPPVKPVTHELKPSEVSYFWEDIYCGYVTLTDPDGAPNCSRLIAGWSGAGFNRHHTLVRFALSALPPVQAGDRVLLEFSLLEIDSDFNLSLGVERLAEAWWQDCAASAEAWRSFCKDELPRGELVVDEWDWLEDEQGVTWLVLDISELYRAWQSDDVPNYGLMLSQRAFISKLTLAGPTYQDENLRPKLVFTPRVQPKTLHFPLAGTYAEEQITGDDFGVWWLNQTCKTGAPLLHTGVDFEADTADTVYAAYDGEVKYATLDPKWGGYVVLEHNGVWCSSYIHVLPSVKQGGKVARGQEIGRIAPGNASFDSHLHFQVLNGKYDPTMARRGRLPSESCAITASPYHQPEPAFPGPFIDPKCLPWE